MTEPDNFASKVDRRVGGQRQDAQQIQQLLQLQRQRTAEQAAQETARQAAYAGHRAEVRRAKEQRDRDHVGTRPEVVWGPEAQELCDTFLTYVSERNFRGALRLRHTDGDQAAWSIRGYGIGGIEVGGHQRRKHLDQVKGHRFELLLGTNLPHNVFLCEDGQLRLYGNSTINSTDVQQRTNAAPSQLSDLPIDEDGRVIVPLIGSFDLSHKPAALIKAATQGSLEVDNPDGPYIVQAGMFRPQYLEDMFVDYAAVATAA